MMTAGKRKLKDCHSFDELVKLQSELKKRRVESSFELRANGYRVLVGIGDLCCARTIVAALAFQEGQKILKER